MQQQQPPRPPAPQTRTVTTATPSTTGTLLTGLPLTQSSGRMTESQKRSKMLPVSHGLRPMNVLLVAHAGLFADVLAGSLGKLASRVEVQRCEPDQLETYHATAALSLVLLDIDAVSGDAAQRVSAARERFAPAAIVALGTALDDNFIATVMGSGVKAYLPKSYSETQALGLLQVVLTGGVSAQANAAQPLAAAQHPARKERAQDNPYGLTARELEVLFKTHEGL